MLKVQCTLAHAHRFCGAAVLVLAASAVALPQDLDVTGKRSDQAKQQPAGANEGQASPETRRADLPAAESIIEQAIESMGGREAFDGIGAMKLRVTRTWPAEMVLEVDVLPPDRMRVWQRVDKYNNEVTILRNGDTCWMRDHRTGRNLQIPLHQAQLTFNLCGYPDLMLVQELASRYSTIETMSRTLYDGTQCFRLRLADEVNPEPGSMPGDSFIYFAVDSHLPLALEKAPRVERGSREVQRFRAWEHLGDLQIFTRVELAKGHDRGLMKYDFIEFGTVDPESFAIPENLEDPAEGSIAAERNPGRDVEPEEAVEAEDTTLRSDLPAAEEILRKAVEAMGGSAAYEEIDTIRLHVEVGAGRRQHEHLIDFAPPDRLHVRRPRPDSSALVVGMNGNFAWWHLPGGDPIRVDQSRLAQELDIARMPWIVHDLTEDFNAIETLDRVSFNGQDCYKLRLRGARQLDPGEVAGDHFAYFETVTGRIVGTESPLLRDPDQYGTTLYRDWKELGGLTLFTRVETRTHGSPHTRIVKVFELNSVDPSVFEVPENVKNAPEPPRAVSRPGGTVIEASPGGGS